MQIAKKIKNTVQLIGGKLAGINKTNKQVDTLFYFLDNCVDISSLPVAKNADLRSAQLMCTELLHIFDVICKKHNLVYWLDSGTLLGAVRHNGFIPWDDDLDVAMPREDYNKLLPLVKDEMSKYGIVVRSGGYFDDRGPMERLAFAYKTLETGAWLDVFPADKISTNLTANEIEKDLRAKGRKYHDVYTKHRKKWSEERILQAKERFLSGFPAGSKEIVFTGPEYDTFIYFIVDKESVFPLKKHVFEHYEFSVPNNWDVYLTSEYGDYMKFPRSGIEGHKDPDGNDVKSRIQRSGVNVEAEIEYLKKVAFELESGN